MKNVPGPFRFILISCLMAGIPITTSAQIWKNMGKKIEQKVEDQASRRLERKIDQAIDKSFDSVENAADEAVKSDSKTKKESKEEAQQKSKSESNSSSVPNMAAIMNALGHQNAAPLISSYDFKVGVTYQITTQSGKGKNDNMVNMTLWISEKPYVGMDTDAGKKMFMVMDGERMITFMEESKAYMVMSTNALQASVAEEAGKSETPGEFSISRIGSEKILGYDCDVYLVKTDENESKIWLTNHLGVSPGKAYLSSFSTMMKNSKTSIPQNLNVVSGVMLKMESVNTKSKEEVKMVATQVNKDGKTIDTSEYKSLGF